MGAASFRMSSPVTTMRTPGTPSAGPVSMPRMLACGYGLLTKAT